MKSGIGWSSWGENGVDARMVYWWLSGAMKGGNKKTMPKEMKWLLIKN